MLTNKSCSSSAPPPTIRVSFPRHASEAPQAIFPPFDSVPQPAQGVDEALDRIRSDWEQMGVQRALRSGFPGLADALAARLLSRSDLSDSLRSSLLNARLQAALVRGDVTAASAHADTLAESGFPVDPLMGAFLDYFAGRPEVARVRLDALVGASLSPEGRAWAQVLRALLLMEEGATEAANDAFLTAERMAPTASLRDQFEIVRFREDIRRGVADAASISALRESTRFMRGERGGFEAARLLAIALNRDGETGAAIDVLNDQLTLAGLREFNLRADFLILLGTVAGPASQRGRLALREVAAGEGTAEQQALALALLAQAAVSTGELTSFVADLDSWLQQQPAHALTERLLVTRAFFLAFEGQYSQAEESAAQLLESYPATRFQNAVLRLLAFTSWRQTPPRFRTAADYLNQLRQRLGSGDEFFRAGVLVADCYFLNGDYASASDAYGAMFRDASGEAASDILFQRVLSEILADRPETAAGLIDGARQDERISPEVIWRAEWNLLDHLRRTGRVAAAFSRINRSLGPEGPGLSLSMQLRFRWLRARLSLEAGEAGQAVDLARGLLDELNQGVFAEAADGQLREVESHLLLLSGEAQIGMGQRSEGLATFARLRERFPGSGPAILSYLVESRSESAQDNLVSAQQSLVLLVDRFPGSEYAPIALWEAALNAEQRGLNPNLQEAIGLLERLATQYAGNPLVYYARLKQGDLARRLNDFPTALLLYERLLALYPDHPERFRAELSRADCLMALGSDDPERFDLAAVIYERNCLLPAAPLPVRLEAGFKWSHALLQLSDREGAKGVLWLLHDRFVADPDLGQAALHAEGGRYWVSRILLELGAQLASDGAASSARAIYQMHLQLKLPGAALVNSRMESLR